MRQCFYLAQKGQTSPNPKVGCVIVKDNKIMASGFHLKAGSPHAELDAIEKVSGELQGATLYTNLEPCCHTNKRTPPCAQRIISEGITKVVISNLDPNPLVAGAGVELLKKAGIEVISGILSDEGEELNEIFFKNMRFNKAFIHLKIAQSLDGKIATQIGDSQWISNEKSREKVHKWRQDYDCVLIGAGTLRQDNPKLTARLENSIQCPWRVVLSRSGNLPIQRELFQDEFSHKTIVAIAQDQLDVRAELISELEKQSVHVIPVKLKDNNLDLEVLLDELYSFGVRSVLVEGGQKVFTSFIEQKQYDRISFFIAPKIIGKGIDSVGDLSQSLIHQSLELQNVKMDLIDNNFFVSGKGSHLCLQD
mgnify:CR=1 FL=1